MSLDSKTACEIHDRWQGYLKGKQKRTLVYTKAAAKDIASLLTEIAALERLLAGVLEDAV